DLVPHLIPPSSGFCREGNHWRGGICFCQIFQRVAQLIVGEPVALGRDEKMSSGRGFPGQRTSKKLMLRVRPGVELVRAILSPIRVLITLDFPTFERPRNATSGKVGAGKW